MNKDYLILVALGLFGLLVHMLISGKTGKESFRLKLHISAVYLMIILGIVGIVLLIIDLL